VKIALDPYMLRSTPLLELPALVAELGYEYLELSPREDFMPFFLHPRADDATVALFKKALDGAGVKVAANLPLYRWSGPDEDERQAAVRYWKRAIEITVQLDCTVMNSEFNGRPEQASRSEAQFWRSMDELLPVFEREGVELRLEPHPDDFVEDGKVAIDMIRGINSPLVSFLYCAPHTFHMGARTPEDMVEIMEYAGPLLTQLHVADSFNHTGSSGLRYILNPPGTPARIHQHLDIGQGEVDWDRFFDALDRLGFADSDRNVMTACVFAWEERARESSIFMRETIERYVSGWSQ
jgi:myo-inositol catabolism protein IolH